MRLTEIVVEGTLKSDGTLELNGKPNLSPGPVTIVLRQQMDSKPASESVLEYVQRSRSELEARGSYFMNEEEVVAWIEELRPKVI